MSDIEEDGEATFEICDIRAEKTSLQMGKELLIEWADYPMHESSWEPWSGIMQWSDDVVSRWDKHKARMPNELFEAFNEENLARYAMFKAEERSRMPKHRKNCARRVVENDSEDDDADCHAEGTQTPVGREASYKYFIDIREVSALGSLPPPTYVSFDHVGTSWAYDTGSSEYDSESSESDTPLAQQRRHPPPQVKHLTSAPTASQELYEDLFVDSQDSNPLGPPSALEQADDSLFVGPRAVPRAAPFHQSDEEDSATDDRSGSSDDDSSIRHNGQTKNKPGTNNTPDLGSSILTSKSPKSRTARQRSNPPSERNESEGSEQARSPVLSRANTVAEKSRYSNSSTSISPNMRRPSGSDLQVSSTTTVEDNSLARQQVPATNVPAPSISSHSKTGPAEVALGHIARKTGPSLKSSNPIRMTNNPEVPKKKQWESDKHFGTLKFRRHAEKRARTEGNPDLNALDFVDAAPSTLPRANPKAPADNPYGRREVRNVRVPENSDQEESRHRPAPMADWESSKVPLVCYNWRLSNSCAYPPSKCVFLHRNTDENGFDLPIGDEHGYVPPKYRKPPVTCLFWLEDPKGCSKPDRECAFSHRNTGYKLLEGTRGQTVPMDPSLPPITERDESGFWSPSQPTSASFIKTTGNSHVSPKTLTCHWWLEGSRGCSFSEPECRFAHTNTGWALQEGINGKPVRIDPSLVPVIERAPKGHISSKSSVPTPTSEHSAGFLEKRDLTCRYWLEASKGCTNSDANCQFAHRNTGWTLINGARVQLDPTLIPVNKQISNAKKLSTQAMKCPVTEQPHNFHMPAKSLTCRQWLEDSTGCKHSDAECEFAHRNTGWKQVDATGKHVQINPTLLPCIDRSKSSIVRQTNPNDYRDRTCWFWANARCLKSDDQCIFKHRITDVLAGRNRAEQPRPVCLHHLEYKCRHGTKCTKAHIDLARLKREGLLQDDANPNLIPMRQRDISQGVQEQNVRPDPSVQHEMSPGADVPIPVSPLVEQVPSSLRAHRTQEAGVHESASTVRQQPFGTDLEITLPPVKLSSMTAKHEIEEALHVTFTSLFEWSDNGAERVMLDRKALLVFHPVDHQEELELLTRWLLLHHVEVSNAWLPGAWYYHREQIITGGSGIVITHPSFEQFSDLAGFGLMLGKQVRLWSLGVQTNIEHDPAALNCPSDTKLDCIEIFPVGGLIYMTEDVFEEMPQLALKIVKLFCAKIDSIHSISGSNSLWQEIQEVNLHWRLCVRPELMEYLLQRCEEQHTALEAGDANVQARAVLYTLLSDSKLIEQDTPTESFGSKYDSYPIMSERRIIAEGQPLDYFGALARNREEATTRMVQYYGCVHLDMRRDYRHFYVVHTEPRAPSVTQWKSKNHVLSDVITPEQCISELSKDGFDPESSSIFDFYERYLTNSSKEPAYDSNTKTLAST